MKLDRNLNPDGRGKYALILLRTASLPFAEVEVDGAKCYAVPKGCVDFGDTPHSDFFVIRLRDKWAFGALREYSLEAAKDGEHEFAGEVALLAVKALTHLDKHLAT